MKINFISKMHFIASSVTSLEVVHHWLVEHSEFVDGEHCLLPLLVSSSNVKAFLMEWMAIFSLAIMNYIPWKLVVLSYTGMFILIKL